MKKIISLHSDFIKHYNHHRIKTSEVINLKLETLELKDYTVHSGDSASGSDIKDKLKNFYSGYESILEKMDTISALKALEKNESMLKLLPALRALPKEDFYNSSTPFSDAIDNILESEISPGLFEELANMVIHRASIYEMKNFFEKAVGNPVIDLVQQKIIDIGISGRGNLEMYKTVIYPVLDKCSLTTHQYDHILNNIPDDVSLEFLLKLTECLPELELNIL